MKKLSSGFKPFARVFPLLVILFAFASCRKNDAPSVNDNISNLSLDSIKILAANIPTAMYADLTFINENTGFAVTQGSIVKTADGGHTWTSITTPVTTALTKIQFTDSQTGYIIGGENTFGVLLKTIDGGQNWTVINFPTGVNGMYFLNNSTGFITGNNLFIKTTDGGETWANLKSNTPRIYNDVNFKNASEGIATAAEGVYFKTVNGGVSWDSIQTPAKSPLFKIYYTGSKSLAVKSADTLIDLANNYAVTKKPNDAYKLLFLNSNKCIGIGSHYEVGFWPYGDIFITNNGWTNFNQKTYTQVEAIGFGAIAEMSAKKIMILGTGFSGTKVIVLNR